MDHSLNKTRFQGVKLIFDSENKQIFPEKHVRSLKIEFFHPKMYVKNVENVKNILKLFPNFS